MHLWCTLHTCLPPAVGNNKPSLIWEHFWHRKCVWPECARIVFLLLLVCFPFGSKLTPRAYGRVSFSVRPRAITEEQYPFFSLWAVSPFGGKLPARQLFCVTLPRVHPAFQQRVPWHGARYPAVEALIPFLSPTRLSFRLLWSSSGKITNILFLLWAKIFPSWRFFLLHRWHILFSPLHLMASTYSHSSPQPRRHSVK